MNGTLTQSGQAIPATYDNVLAAIAGKEFFWLDLDDSATDGTVGELLTNHFGFHHLAVQAAEKFSQRPRLDQYEDFVYLVARGADPHRIGNVEVHCFWTETYVVTVHRGDCPTMHNVMERIGRHKATEVASPQIVVVYLVLDAMVESFFPVLSEFDDRIDALEDDILKAPTEAQLGLLFDMKRSLMEMRKAITPQRDMMAGLNSNVTDLPGLTEEATRYFRDLYDHLIRLADLVDSYRDLLSSVMDTHLSTVSNRLNVVMKQLAIIATVFLPLTFLTGFFGQNFSWLVGHLTGRVPFLALGLGSELVAIVILLVLFKRRGWLGGPTV